MSKENLIVPIDGVTDAEAVPGESEAWTDSIDSKIIKIRGIYSTSFLREIFSDTPCHSKQIGRTFAFGSTWFCSM